MPTKTGNSRPTAKPAPPAPKATRAEIARRVEEVLRVRIDGAQFHDIVQYASEKRWGVGERQLWEYLARADELLAARLETSFDRLFARHVAQRHALYARAVAAADYRTALAVLQDEARLRGLYPAEKKQLEVRLPMPDLTRIGADELFDLVARLGPLFAGTALGGGVPAARPRALVRAVEPVVPARPRPGG